MKSINMIIIFLVCIYPVKSGYLDEEWKSFKIKFKKSYKSYQEESKKFEVFKENLKFIMKHNENITTKFRVGLNRDGDVTEQEILEEMKQKSG